VIVVGGTYDERVIVPAREEVAGSGLRSAAALGSQVGVRLATALDVGTAPTAESAFATLSIDAVIVERDQSVGFRYFTPVAAPSIDGSSASYPSVLSADDEVVLAFGMVETGSRRIRARRVVFDPQRPRDLAALDLHGITADEMTIVANARETRALAPDAPSLDAAARQILGNNGVDAVVVKDSTRGCLVVTAAQSVATKVGPYPTKSVWPLGSGDVFAAGYSSAWANGADPVEAARVASGSAAWWCGTRVNQVPPQILAGTPVNQVLEDAAAELPPSGTPPKVYLAAPFFSLADRWLVETCRTVLLGLGAEVFSPLHDVGPGGDEVARRDLDGLDRSDAVLALLDGWDPGTLYEVGWAHRKGLPVVGFLHGATHEGTKMLVGTGAELHQDLSSALYRSVWAAQGHPLTPNRVTQ
jgi:hypothetical protein